MTVSVRAPVPAPAEVIAPPRYVQRLLTGDPTLRGSAYRIARYRAVKLGFVVPR